MSKPFWWPKKRKHDEQGQEIIEIPGKIVDGRFVPDPQHKVIGLSYHYGRCSACGTPRDSNHQRYCNGCGGHFMGMEYNDV